MAEQVVDPRVLPVCEEVFGSGAYATLNSAYAAWRVIESNPEFASSELGREALDAVTVQYNSSMDLHYQREVVLMRARATAEDQLSLDVIDAQFRLSPRTVPAIFDIAPDQRFTDWLANASLEQLDSFRYWNEHSLRVLQEQLRQQVRTLHGPLLQEIGNLTAKAVLPPQTPALMSKALESAIVHIFDPLAAGTRLCIMECIPKEYRIGISELVVGQPDLQEYVSNAYIHQAGVVDGGDSLDSLCTDRPAAEDSPYDSTWLDKAVVAHLAAATWHGEIGTLNPLERQHRGLNVLERVLASLLHERAAQPITVQSALGAYFDRTPRRSLRRDYREQIEAGWQEYLPEHVAEEGLLRVIARNYNQASSLEMEQQVLVTWIERLANSSQSRIPNLAPYLNDEARKVYGVPYSSLKR